MFEIANETPFEVALVPGADKEGRDHAVVILKGTFDLEGDGDDLPLAEEQAPVLFADEFYGEPGESSVKYESDICLRKGGTDVVLVGNAYPRGGKAKIAEVRLQVGPLDKRVRVFGERAWYRKLGFWKHTEPEPFEIMPLLFEKAFGGADTTDADPEKHDYEKRNPVGTGFAVASKKERLEGLALPNLEDPEALITSWKDRPVPAGFGFFGRGWEPRVGHAGTYDEAWQEKRCPLLPEDFDERYFNGGAPGLVASPHLEGGERVRLAGAAPDGVVGFTLPARDFEVDIWLKGRKETSRPVLDTVVIEPDAGRLMLTWRSTVPCPREFVYIDCVIVTEA
jgi:hypothetical protein